MDLDLVTYSSTINNSINLFNNSKISWIVLGYTSNATLNVIETGDSFENMFEEFDANKVMYGFAAVTDPNTKFKKNVFIYWHGEAASSAMKTMSVQHFNIVRELCKPIHVTYNARDEQDLVLNEIMSKISSASGSNFNCLSSMKPTPTVSVKCEETTAQSMRQARLKELSALSSLHKDTVTEQQVSSKYEKVDAVKELQNLRNTVIETSSPVKAVGTNYTKIDASKEIKFSSPAPYRDPVLIQHMSTTYKKIDPVKELKSLNVNQKIMFENKTKVTSENNTAQKAKEDREKELSNLMSKRIIYDDNADRRVGTNYTKVNPVAEIKKLKSMSISHDDDDEEVFSCPSSNYKRINPNVELRKMRRSSSSEPSEIVSHGTNYKKINPMEEIKRLRSQSTFEDTRPINHSYKKIDPKEEILTARKLSVPINHIDTFCTAEVVLESTVSDSNVATSTVPLLFKEVSKDSNKIIKDVQQLPETTFTSQDMLRDQIKPSFNTNENDDNSETSAIVVEEASPIIETVILEPVIVKQIPDENNSIKNTAAAQFKYEATDTDEISFAEGEILQEIEVIDDDWWMGINAAGKRGMFPSSYVEPSDIEQIHIQLMKKKDRHGIIFEDFIERHDTNSHSETNHIMDAVAPCIVSDNQPHVGTISDLTAVAVYDYVANDTDEISFDVGEIIREIEQIDDGWWIGANKAGEKGMFPSNFVELCKIEEIVVDQESNESCQNCNEQEEQATHDLLTVQALYDYCSQDDDELSFVTGDWIYNVAVIDPGWWEGEIVSGQRGLFPSNYVKTV